MFTDNWSSFALLCPAPMRGIKRCFCLTSVWCPCVAYIGPKSRTERPRKSNIGREIVHVVCDLDTTWKSKGQRLKSPVRFTHLVLVFIFVTKITLLILQSWSWFCTLFLVSTWSHVLAVTLVNEMTIYAEALSFTDSSDKPVMIYWHNKIRRNSFAIYYYCSRY